MTRKVTLTIPDELGGRIDKHRDRLNLSAVFAAAVEKEIEELEGPTVEGDLSAVIERLRPQVEEYENQHYQLGVADGIAWAKTEADYPTLARLGNEAPDAFVARTINPLRLDHPMPRGPYERYRERVRQQGEQLNERGYLRGWLDGARAVLRAIQDDLYKQASYRPGSSPRLRLP